VAGSPCLFQETDSGWLDHTTVDSNFFFLLKARTDQWVGGIIMGLSRSREVKRGWVAGSQPGGGPPASCPSWKWRTG